MAVDVQELNTASLQRQGISIDPIDDGHMIINMGPQHPSTHGVLRLELEIEGETIISCVPHMGYVHTGIEKEGEYQTYMKAVTITDRMDYLAAHSNNLAYTLAVEKLLDIAPPPRGQYLRVMLNEIQRIASHMVWLGTHALDIGAMTVFFFTFREREKLLDLTEMMSGVRMMPSWIVPGGLRGDAPEGWFERAKAICDELPRRFDEYETLVDQNPIWRERTQGVGLLTVDDCYQLGVSGPSLRGSGVPHDIRKAQPYSSYEDFEFHIPIGDYGDVYDRYRVRMAEMRQSREIVKQCIERMPDGPINVADRKVTPPPRYELDSSMEAVIHHFKLWTEGFSPPVGEAYVPIESPKGEIGFYMVSNGSPYPWRMHQRPPCFMNLQALSKMAQGRLLADVVAMIGSIDIVLGEIDR
jgi:NADH-quinone oxidoreductase subunit D